MTESLKGHRLEEVFGYRSGLLSAAERAAFEVHLAECASCQADLQEAGGFWSAMSKEVADWQKPGRSTEELLALMEKKDTELQRAPRIESFWTPKFALGLAIAIALVAGLILFEARPN